MQEQGKELLVRLEKFLKQDRCMMCFTDQELRLAIEEIKRLLRERQEDEELKIAVYGDITEYAKRQASAAGMILPDVRYYLNFLVQDHQALKADLKAAISREKVQASKLSEMEYRLSTLRRP